MHACMFNSHNMHVHVLHVPCYIHYLHACGIQSACMGCVSLQYILTELYLVYITAQQGLTIIVKFAACMLFMHVHMHEKHMHACYIGSGRGIVTAEHVRSV